MGGELDSATPSDWPVCYRDQLEVGNRDACVAVCTLWTPRKRVATALDPAAFAVVGNLYSRDGVNAILRNVLANPAIRYIVLCGRALTDSGAALKALLASGVDSGWRVIGNGAQIDLEIPGEAIERFRQNVEVIDLEGSVSPVEARNVMSALKPRPPVGPPELFTEAVRTTDRYPAENDGYVVRGETISETWLRLLFHVMNFGRVTETDYGMRQQEIIGVLAVVDGDADREPGIPEWLPVAAKDVDDYATTFVAPRDPDAVGYSYGHRLIRHWGIDQVDSMVSDLLRSGVTRRALASLWDPRVDVGSQDPPCVTIVQVLVRDERLVMSAYIRSNDIYRAWVQNACGLRRLQTLVAERVDRGVGDLLILSQSAHVYEDCWNRARELLAERQRGVILSRRFEQDPRGSFVIRVSGGTVFVDQYSPAGDKLRTISGRSARELEGLLAPFVSLVEHALYLGRELQRAQTAAAKGLSFEQDAVTEDGYRPASGRSQ
jgi:thymidylate synthase